MPAFLRWVRGRLAARARRAPGPRPDESLSDELSVVCSTCDGNGLCRVCRGRGTVDLLVAIPGADSGMVREPVQQMQTRKCRACPSSSGACKACKGRGRAAAAASDPDATVN